jgi:3-oxoacyl-[acyl-carrier-protein] synthase II
MSDRRVVITGIGVVSPVGNDLETFWTSLKGGRSGIGPITAFDTEKFDCKIAGEVRDYDPTPFYKTPKDVRRTDRYTQLAMGAAKMSLDDSGLDLGSVDLDRCELVLTDLDHDAQRDRRASQERGDDDLAARR